jgi:hypothetical protein
MEKKMKKTSLPIGLLDLLILILLAAGVLFAVKFSVPVVSAANTGDNMTFVVELQKKDEAFAKNINLGEKLYENLKGIYLGEVTEVKTEPYRTPSPDLNAAVRRDAAVSGLVNVYLTVKGSSVSSGGATVINGYEIAVGKEMFVRTRSVASPAYCVKINLGGV